MAAAAVLLIAVASARAEPIVALSPLVSGASAVTDAAGTLHAVGRLSVLDPDGNTVIGYCRVPAAGTACSTVTRIGGFPHLTHEPHIFQRPQDGMLIILMGGRDENSHPVTFVLTSADGGTTWSAPRIAATGLCCVDEAALTSDGSAVDNLVDIDLVWQRVPIDGGVETRSVDLRHNADGSDPFQTGTPNVGQLADGRPMIVAEGTDLGVRARVLAGADPYVSTNWTAWNATARLGGIGVRVAFGPNGTWALTSGSVLFSGFYVWKWNSRRFAKPRSLGTLGGPATSNLIGGVRIGNIHLPAFAQDAGGRLHAVWDQYQLCGPRRQCLIYRRNEPRGFGLPVVYPLPAGLSEPRAVTIAANAGGSGWIVWSDSVAGSGGPDFATPLVTPPRGSRVGSRRILRRRVTVPAHNGCIPPGGRFVHRLLVSGRRPGVRIRSVRFFFDNGELPRIDRRPPFRVIYRLPFLAGTRHVASADVTYRSGRRTRTASVGRMIVMCP